MELEVLLEVLLVELEVQLEVLLEGSWISICVCVPGLCSTSPAHPGNACSSSSPTHHTPWPWGRDEISELDSSRVRNATLGTLDMSSPWLVCFRPARASKKEVPLCDRAPKWLEPKWLRTLSALWLLVCCCCCWV